MRKNTKERQALATLILHVTGNLGDRTGNPYSHRAVRDAVEALGLGSWSDTSTDAVRAAAVEPESPKDTDLVLAVVVVKGDPVDASAAAMHRRIPAVIASFNGTETILHAPQKYATEIAAWFAEPSGPAPFRAGSCLFYSFSNAKHLSAQRTFKD